MPCWKGNNGKFYIKVKEPIRGSRKVLRPADLGMEQRSWATKKEAQEAEKELKRLVEEKYSKTTKKTTPSTLLPLCKLWLKSYEGQVKGHDTLPKKARFCKEILSKWGDIPATEVRVYMVQTYLNERANKFTANSYNTYKKEGKALFNWLIDQELVPYGTRNVFSKVKKMGHDTEKVQPAPLEDVIAVRNVANQSQRDLIDSYVLVGPRKMELLTMRWDDIKIEDSTFKLHTNKSGGKGTKTTIHTISDEFMAILLRRLEQRHPTVPYVFWHKYYSHKEKQFVEDGYKSLNRFTQRLCKKAGVPLFTLHQLRHLAASILKKEGATIAELQRFLRHDEQRTTEIYAGHLDNGTKTQNVLLGKVWSKALNGDDENDICV